MPHYRLQPLDVGGLTVILIIVTVQAAMAPPSHRGQNTLHADVTLSSNGVDADGVQPKSGQPVDAPEGSSLRTLLAMCDVYLPNADDWEIFYDEESGHPYYFNKVKESTQWDNPFGVIDVDSQPWQYYESWRLYERFDFRGVLDDATCIRHKSRLPRSGPNLPAMRQIARLSSSSVDETHARLEIALFKLEAAAYGSLAPPSRSSWSREVNTTGAVDVQRPFGVSLDDRVLLAGGWNDLGNMWYARGEWELCLDCFRRSLFWNHGHTSTLLNLAGVMVKLGFERDARSVMEYYDVIQGGTMGGWKPDKENAIRSAIDRGLKLAESPRNGGRTRGEIQLFGPLNPAYLHVDPTTNATQPVSSVHGTTSNASASFSAQSHIKNQGNLAAEESPVFTWGGELNASMEYREQFVKHVHWMLETALASVAHTSLDALQLRWCGNNTTIPDVSALIQETFKSLPKPGFPKPVKLDDRFDLYDVEPGQKALLRQRNELWEREYSKPVRQRAERWFARVRRAQAAAVVLIVMIASLPIWRPRVSRLATSTANKVCDLPRQLVGVVRLFFPRQLNRG